MRYEDTSILINISSGDKEKIRERMRKAGIKNMSAFIRKMAIDGYIIVLDLSDVKEVLRLLGINANNLNQYAKKANAFGTVYREDIKKLQQQQSEILDEMRGITDRLTQIT